MLRVVKARTFLLQDRVQAQETILGAYREPQPDNTSIK
jgi:hypothetical protein